MSELLAVSAALERLLSTFSILEPETVPLAQSVGRVLAEDIAAPNDLPAFDNSSMDGFALRSDDLAGTSPEKPIELEVVADLPAGQSTDRTVEAGQAVRIMTGAPLPPGADAVVPVEDTDAYRANHLAGKPAPQRVKVFRSVKPGEFVRKHGQDIRQGESALLRGHLLRAQEAGFLAMLGCSQVSVYRRPRVAILSTGDELVPVETQLTPGKIHESNGVMLEALVQPAGGQALQLGVAPDEENAVAALLAQALDTKADLILSSAGVSVGAFDFVRKVVEQDGRLEFWRVNMRPGKPFAFGSYHGTPFIGLPGNPVSAFVGFEVFVRPALQKMGGLPGGSRPRIKAKLAEAVVSDGRESYLRGVTRLQDGRWVARLTGHQGSGNLRSLVDANTLLIIPSGVKSLPSGAEVEAWLLNPSLEPDVLTGGASLG